jgi:hypothetical protein
MRSNSSGRAARAERALTGVGFLRTLGILALVAGLTTLSPARADRQMDPELRGVVKQAIAEAECDAHAERFEEEVFLKLQEPRLARIVSSPPLRREILRRVYCQTESVVRRYREQRHIELKLTPALVLAVIDIESHFDRYAVSPAGAVGLMQVMPFWPRSLGVENRLFGNVEFNIRLGCEILAFYMASERNDYRRALSRYNGSTGRREYPDLVLGRLTSRWRG